MNRNIVYTLKNMIKKNQQLFIFSLLYVFLTYGAKYVLYTVNFDTAALIADYNTSTLEWWMQLGRYSLVCMKKIFENGFLNSNQSNVLAIFVYALSATIWAGSIEFLIPQLSYNFGFLLKMVFCATLISSPIMVEQFSFTLQNWEVISGICLAFISALFLWNAIKTRNIKSVCVTIALSVWIMGLYQVLVCAFIVALFWIYLIDISLNDDEKRDGKQLFKFLTAVLCCVIVSYVLYNLLNKVILKINNLTSASYISNYIKWGKRPTLECVNAVLNEIKDYLFTTKFLYYSPVYGLLYLIFLLFGIRYKNKLEMLVVRIIIALSPWYMSVLFGNWQMFRIQIIFPLATAIITTMNVYDVYFCLKRIKGHLFNRKNMVILGTLFILVFDVRNSQIVNQALHSEYLEYNYSVYQCYQIDSMINAVLDDSNSEVNTIAFVGKLDYINIPNNIRYENVGSNIFHLGWAQNYDQSRRITYFMNTLGLNYSVPSEEEYNAACEKATADQVYPKEGCIEVIDNIIVVILSNE